MARNDPGQPTGSGDAFQQPCEDFLMLDLTSGDALDHRYIDIR
jgi:hypothetical protein